MGMSTHIVGFKPPDEDWKKMKAVYDACEAAKIDVPSNVGKFFAHREPDEAGVEVDLDPEQSDAVSEWSDNYRSGFQVDLSKLPKDIKFIRFYNAW